MKLTTIVNKAFEDFDKQIRDTLRKRLGRWCQDIVKSAVKMRLEDPKAHNFTGNLLNSIVVCLYEDNNPTDVWYAADEPNVKEAIRVKMTKRDKLYSFVKKGDYEGAPTKYKADVPTNEGWGIDDAKEFFFSYKPSGNNMFTVVVGYAVEYADWVQIQRKTTGFLETLGYARHSGMQFMELKAA